MKEIVNKVIGWAERQVKRGERLQKWFPLFESIYTTFYGDKDVTRVNPHVRDAINTKRYYFILILSIGTLFLHATYNQAFQLLKSQNLPIRIKETWVLGYHLVIPKLVAVIVIGLIIEAIFAYKKQKEIQEAIPVFALLYLLILPITAPLWLAAGAFGCAIFIREIQNKVNLHPALIAWLFVEIILRFPHVSPLWQSPNATFWMGLSAIFLMLTHMISKRQFLHTAVGAVITVIVLKLILPYKLQTAWDLLMKSTLLTATFFTTDIHTAPQSPEGRVYYGKFFGVLAIIALVVTKREESLLLMLLLFNLLSPYIDKREIEKRLQKRIAH